MNISELALDYKNRTFALGKNIAVFVERQDDEDFWKTVLAKFAPSLSFEFYYNLPRPNGKATANKYAVLQYETEADNQLWLCVDSDYDYLIDENNERLEQNSYIFQTYCYSIENYYCCLEDLAQNCRILSMNETSDLPFDFVDFMKKYNTICYNLFIKTLNYKELRENIITIIKIDTINVHKIEEFLEDLKQKISQYFTNSQIPELDETMHIKWQNKGLSIENLHWFLRGKDLQKAIISPLQNSVIKFLKNEKYKQLAPNEREIYTKQLRSENSVVFQNSTCWQSEFMQKIGSKIKIVG